MQDLLHRGGAPWRPARGAAGRHVLLALAALALIIAASGCLAKSGTYAPIDWAAEMHYTQTYRPQEPPRLDSPPGAVPFKFAGDARALTREPHYDAEDYADADQPPRGRGRERTGRRSGRRALSLELLPLPRHGGRRRRPRCSVP